MKNKTRTRIRIRMKNIIKITIKIKRHLPYSYILLQQEDIFHIHIFLSNKKTSSISTYSYPTRRHLPYPYIFLQQEHIFFSHKKTPYILLQQEDMSIEHIPCLDSISHVHTAYPMSPEHTHVSRAYI